MRFILVILIWIVFVGGLFTYTSHRADLSAAPAAQPPALEKQPGTRISLELTPTFSGTADPFARRSDTRPAAQLTVRINGQLLKPSPGELHRGRPLLIEPQTSLHVGTNEIMVVASPPLEDDLAAHGIRVRIMDGRRPIADRTIWAEGGALVSGVVSFDLDAGGPDGR
ncbi:hypothetical protein [Desulfofustis glycolicus]|uniref:Uncharacterized protein n=1 Tax=Desulfofustis glycolicus DSM 9705 TaxID=1121409 RepID=A0A1M5RVN9_9BACT|nr:hypothetical protein [Desulfofustis glycolicus]SHH30304.1 hypothetical protein SAMN02745124_00021 [Desulfofustis glycolicus DSM 9705]